ncbi:hemerythrin domain-containing protein [Streptomyces tateyamensis]|nr:hemerythrin domain-containing protein [Streptomyces tateyamensis]
MDHDGDLLREMAAEHDEIRTLCSALTGMQLGDHRRKSVLDRLAGELVRHGGIEEACLYPLMRRVPGTEALAAEAAATHRDIATLLDRLAWRTAVMPGFDRLVALLVTQVTAHLGQEEAKAFAVLRSGVSGHDLERAGARARQLRVRVEPTAHPAM